jgi:hypothetical protein
MALIEVDQAAGGELGEGEGLGEFRDGHILTTTVFDLHAILPV